MVAFVLIIIAKSNHVDLVFKSTKTDSRPLCLLFVTLRTRNQLSEICVCVRVGVPEIYPIIFNFESVVPAQSVELLINRAPYRIV